MGLLKEARGSQVSVVEQTLGGNQRGQGVRTGPTSLSERGRRYVNELMRYD